MRIEEKENGWREIVAGNGKYLTRRGDEPSYFRRGSMFGGETEEDFAEVDASVKEAYDEEQAQKMEMPPVMNP